MERDLRGIVRGQRQEGKGYTKIFLSQVSDKRVDHNGAGMAEPVRAGSCGGSGGDVKCERSGRKGLGNRETETVWSLNGAKIRIW